MYHMDMSVWAFEKLADPGVGVIGIQYREVQCSYKPDKPAPGVGLPQRNTSYRLPGDTRGQV